MAKKIVVSIIITHYKVQQQLFDCVRSIYEKSKYISTEIIVVDNDENPTIEKQLVKEFPNIIYIKNSINNGYSGGNNLGARYAKGDFIFFLNPDTLFINDVLSILLSDLEKQKNVGIVAPLLFNPQKEMYPLQGARELTPTRAIFSLSFIQKIFPSNKISNEYWVKDWNRKTSQEVDVIPGTAFMIRKSLFEKLHGFDETYFLFFEEHDLCNRVKKLGLKIVILPQAQLIHSWGESTKKSSHNIHTIFTTSRFYYFKKFYGLPRALITEGILRLSKEIVLMTCILFLATFLRFYQLSLFMSFIGDFGWFYISARDMLLTGHIPLVGIPSSHPWLHQGPFWTYILADSLWIGNFNPLFGAYASAVFGILTVLFLYIYSKEIFGKNVALLSALFFASSPLVVSFSRMPYHTAPIPFFVLLYIYALYKWVQGKEFYFFLSLLWLVVLYNFELAAAVLIVPFILIFLYGVLKNKKYLNFNKNNMVRGFLLILIPFIPMLMYDSNHSFVQTVGFVSWIGYRLLVLFGYPTLHPEVTPASYYAMVSFWGKSIHTYFYLPNFIFAWLFALAVFSRCIFILLTNKKSHLQILLLALIIPLLFIFLGRVPSEAYLPMLFIQLSLLIGVAGNSVMEKGRVFKIVIMMVSILIVLSNTLSLISQNFFATPHYTFIDKKIAAKRIIMLSGRDTYILKGKGSGSEFDSFIMPYAYLTWWYGKPESKNGKIRIFVEEKPEGIIIEKEYN